MFYATLGSEVLRIGRNTSCKDDFVRSATTLLNRMKDQGSNNESVGKVLRKMYGCHDTLHKFAINARTFTNLLFLTSDNTTSV